MSANLEVEVARLQERVSAIEEWQTKQNGTLQRLEAKVDGMTKWLIGLLGSALLSLVLLIFDLLARRPGP